MPKSNYKVDMHSSQLKYWALQSNPDNPRYNTTTYNKLSLQLQLTCDSVIIVQVNI